MHHLWMRITDCTKVADEIREMRDCVVKEQRMSLEAVNAKKQHILSEISRINDETESVRRLTASVISNTEKFKKAFDANERKQEIKEALVFCFPIRFPNLYVENNVLRVRPLETFVGKCFRRSKLQLLDCSTRIRWYGDGGVLTAGCEFSLFRAF
jgi:hypothetical protein